MKWIYDNMNVSASIMDPNCMLSDGCIFPQNIAGDNMIPTFVFNSQYDSWQVNNILGTTNAALINELGNVSNGQNSFSPTSNNFYMMSTLIKILQIKI